MKKFILILLGLIFTASSAYALKSNYQNIPAGIYTCQGTKTTCVIYKQKNGEITLDKKCDEKLTDSYSKYAPMIQRKRCKFEPDPNKYYLCEFADSKCDVILNPSAARVSCTNPKKAIPKGMRIIIDQKVLQFAKEGKCKDLFPDPVEETKK